MKSVIAQRSSGLRASRNDGIGVPFSPMLIVLKMSSRDEPPRNVQLWARSAGRIGWPQSSFNVGADGPSPRPSVPWHFTQPVSTYSFFPCSMDSLVDEGALGSATGLGAFSGLANSGEKDVTKSARSDTCWSVKSGHAGIDEYGMPRRMTLTRSWWVGSAPF